MLTTSIPRDVIDRGVEQVLGEESPLHTSSAPREQREELSGEDAVGLGVIDFISDLKEVLYLYPTITFTSPAASANIWKLLHFYIANFIEECLHDVIRKAVH